MFAVYMLIALIPSIAGAISGIGGGIIIKPALDFTVAVSGGGLGAPEINFLSGSTVLAMAAVSLLRSRKSGIRLEGGRGIALAGGAVFGGFCGNALFAIAAGAISSSAIGAAQSAMLVILTGLSLLYTKKKGKITTKNLRFLPLCVIIGLGLGMISSFLGIGGGPVNIMAISYFFSMDSKTSALHSLFIIFLSQLANLILAFIMGLPAIPAPVLIAMICGGVSGALLGSRLLRLFRNEQIDTLFTILMVAVMALSAYNCIRFIR